jgi:hypothetical protein
MLQRAPSLFYRFSTALDSTVLAQRRSWREDPAEEPSLFHRFSTAPLFSILLFSRSVGLRSNATIPPDQGEVKIPHPGGMPDERVSSSEKHNAHFPRLTPDVAV